MTIIKCILCNDKSYSNNVKEIYCDNCKMYVENNKDKKVNKINKNVLGIEIK